MDAEIIKVVAQTAGVGGIALGVLLLLFREVVRRNLFPNLSRDQGYKLIRLVVNLTFAIAVFGIGAWVWVQKPFGVDRADSPVTALGGDKPRSDVSAPGNVTQTIYGGTGVIQTGSGQITNTNTEDSRPVRTKDVSPSRSAP